jgi:hypothetical protein
MPDKAKPPNIEITFLGFDSEYTARDRATLSATGDATTERYNHVLSYQIYGLHGDREWDDFILIDNERWTFRRLIKHAIERGLASGALLTRPKNVYLCAHFSRADLTTLSDFQTVVRQMDCCRNTLTTLMRPVKIAFTEDEPEDENTNVYVRDSLLLTPEGKGKLEAIGELIGYPKVDISPFKKDRMDLLLEQDPDLFRRYAMMDPKISVQYVKRITELAAGLWEADVPPVTIGGCATKFALHTWRANKIDSHAVLGTEVIKIKAYKRTHTEVQKLEKRALYEQHARNSFAGGRNEAFYFGAAPQSHYFDYDLKGAYSTAMAYLGMPQWNKLRATTDIEEFVPHVIGCAKVKFRFPPDTRFPCLPVREEGSLIFPLWGEGYVTAPEIFLARAMGAELEVTDGCVMPMDFSVRPFLALSKRIGELRKLYKEKHGEKSLWELFIKTLGNSIYGKLAQAVRERRMFDTRIMDMKLLGESPITNPYLASAVTGLIRAVLGEMLSRVPKENRVLSVTTDGFLADVPKERWPLLCEGEIGRLFSTARELIDGDPGFIEVKHEVEELIVWRTRGTATVFSEDDFDGKPRLVILARAGFKRRNDLEISEESDLFIDRFLDRKAGEVTTFERLRGVRDIAERGGDMISVEARIRYTMDFDWKRLPEGVDERILKKRPHLSFDTKPVRCVEDYQHIRASWKDYYKRYGRALKHRVDLADFQEFSGVIESGRLQLPRDIHVVFVAKSMFMIAYFRGVWGLDPELTNKQLAGLLTAGGYQTEVWEVENAKRRTATLRERCIRETPSVRRFLNFIHSRFPSFQEDRLIDGKLSDLW